MSDEPKVYITNGGMKMNNDELKIYVTPQTSQPTPKPINQELQNLKAIYNPSGINIVEQSRIIHEALQPTGDFPRSTKRLAEHLNLSQNKVYKLSYVYEHLIPEVKEWFKTTDYQMSTTYGVATMEPERQAAWLKAIIGETGWGMKPQDTTSTATSTP